MHTESIHNLILLKFKLCLADDDYVTYSKINIHEVEVNNIIFIVNRHSLHCSGCHKANNLCYCYHACTLHSTMSQSDCFH